MHATDVVVIGGGPAGSTTAALLAREGHDVTLLEREVFPRFHVGESLIPAANLTLEKLGILGEMDSRGFPKKYGVQFFSQKRASRPFYFSEAADPRFETTWQVLRGDFDALLLETAQKAGARVLTSARVLDASIDGDRVTGVSYETPDGTTETLRARAVVDASGQQSVLARTLGQRVQIPGLENAAVFAHFDGVALDTGIDAGSTLIFRLSGKAWVWFIPLPHGVSLGLVAPAADLARFGATPEEILETALQASGPLAARLEHAQKITPVRAIRDFSYQCTRDGGPGWLLVGDALAFLDPIYSSGLFLTLRSGEIAAAAIDCALRGHDPDFSGYAARYRVAFFQFMTIVRAFYQEGFHFGELARDGDLRRGLVDLLIGNVETPRAFAVARFVRQAQVAFVPTSNR